MFATAQAPDKLIYEGETHPLHVNPLDEFFLDNKDLKPNPDIITSGNWRGYVATFSINEGSLYVDDITISKSDPDEKSSHISESVIDKVFPDEADRMMAWFSGLLVVPLGELTGYVHLSYASQYERYMLIRIENGFVCESTKMTLEEYLAFKVRQFDVFKTTPEYENLYKELSELSESDDDSDLEGFIFHMGEFTHKVNIPFHSENQPTQPPPETSTD